MAFQWTVTTAELATMLGILMGAIAPLMVWAERRVCAMIQDRPGPNRLGPWGFFQPLADVFKFLFKEDFIPNRVDRPLFLLAPALALLPALTTFVVIPFGPPVEVGPWKVPVFESLELSGGLVDFTVASAETGVLLFLALASLGVYSLVIAGYASHNKYSLMGSIRASAQMISYELALTLSVVAVLLPVGSFYLQDVVAYQREHMWFAVPQAIGFLVFVVAAFAETNRLPFDLPEAESELVAGFHTEYSAMRFAAFFTAEYVNMAVLSALGVTLFLGGWSIPFVDPPSAGWWFFPHWFTTGVYGIIGLFSKTALFLFFFIWVRWTFPRFRYDQLMRLGWKVLLPLALINVVWSAAATLAGWM